MTARFRSRAVRPRRAAALLALLLAGGCEHAFEPFQENQVGAFSMFGFLDLSADTQWVRVMPLRQELLPTPEPLDAVVTLEHLGTGRVVTLRDSLVAYEDEELDGVGYGHNYWTTERLEPGADYRLTATRSDGATTAARIAMPDEVEFTFRNDVRNVLGRVGFIQVRVEHLIFVDVLHLMLSPGDGAVFWHPVAQDHRIHPDRRFSTGDPGVHGVRLEGYLLPSEADMDRHEIRVSAGRSDWPYDPELSDLEISLPGVAPSNVEGGLGFVGGVVTRTIPYHFCEVLAPRADPGRNCEISYTARTASIEGRALRQPCGGPAAYREIRIVERFADGGAISRRWKTGPAGEYRFEGIEAGASLVLELGAGVPPVPLPGLQPGERFTVPDVPVPGGC